MQYWCDFCVCYNWASLSEPHIDHVNSPCARNNGMYLSIYLSMYHLPHVCHILVPEIHVRPEMLRVFRYIDVFTCMIYNCTQQLELHVLVSAVKMV